MAEETWNIRSCFWAISKKKEEELGETTLWCQTIANIATSDYFNICLFIFFFDPSLFASSFCRPLYLASAHFCWLSNFFFPYSHIRSVRTLAYLCGNFISDFHLITKLLFFLSFFHSLTLPLSVCVCLSHKLFSTQFVFDEHKNRNYLHFMPFCFLFNCCGCCCCCCFCCCRFDRCLCVVVCVWECVFFSLIKYELGFTHAILIL